MTLPLLLFIFEHLLDFVHSAVGKLRGDEHLPAFRTAGEILAERVFQILKNSLPELDRLTALAAYPFSLSHCNLHRP